ncbi:unnamed protein product [Tetraodon nigroviridis]|uniref:(spotted green pufferfish) hypothetical protein n=1 Tax=Tetraodon nigroviridis TaxID=99883 RepID=Q4SJA2_TETNG|nr:unnamed protein product [Tetraodon nigroviridis]
MSSRLKTKPSLVPNRDQKSSPQRRVDSELKGPFSQLTKAELISLVLKQENQLSEKDTKICELEQYIDNLLVRVMEEQPSILMSMNSLKKSV